MTSFGFGGKLSRLNKIETLYPVWKEKKLQFFVHIRDVPGPPHVCVLIVKEYHTQFQWVIK